MTVKETTFEKSHLLVNRIFHPNSKKAKALRELIDTYSANNNISGGLMPIFNFLSYLDMQVETPREIDSVEIKYAGNIHSGTVDCKCSLCNARLKNGSRLSFRLRDRDGNVIKRAGAVKEIGSLGSMGEIYVGENHKDHIYAIAKAIGDKDFAKIIENSRHKGNRLETILENESVLKKVSQGLVDEQQLSYIISVVGDLNKTRYDKSVLNAFELPAVNKNSLKFIGEMIDSGKLLHSGVIDAYDRFRNEFRDFTQEDALLVNLAVYELQPVPLNGALQGIISDLKHLKWEQPEVVPDLNAVFEYPSPLGIAEKRNISINEKLHEHFATRAEQVGVYRLVPGIGKRRVDHNREIAQRYSSPQEFEKYFSVVKNLVREQSEEYYLAKKAKRLVNWFMPADTFRHLRRLVEVAESDSTQTPRNNLIQFSEMSYAHTFFQSVYVIGKKSELGVNLYLPAVPSVDFMEGKDELVEKFKHTPFGTEYSMGKRSSSKEYSLRYNAQVDPGTTLDALFADKNFQNGLVVGVMMKNNRLLDMYKDASPVDEETKRKISVLNYLSESAADLKFLVSEDYLVLQGPFAHNLEPYFSPEKFKDAKYLFPCHVEAINKAYERVEKTGLLSTEAIELMKGISEHSVLYDLGENGVLERQELKDMFKPVFKDSLRYVPAENLLQIHEIVGSAVHASEVPSAIYAAKTWELTETKLKYAKEFSEDIFNGKALVSENLKQYILFPDASYNKGWNTHLEDDLVD